MYGYHWLRIASGLALLFSSVMVVAQSLLKNDWGNQLYYGTSLIAVFGYLFLTSRSRKRSTTRPGGGEVWRTASLFILSPEGPPLSSCMLNGSAALMLPM
jgi:hypothetical protein